MTKPKCQIKLKIKIAKVSIALLFSHLVIWISIVIWVLNFDIVYILIRDLRYAIWDLRLISCYLNEVINCKYFV